MEEYLKKHETEAAYTAWAAGSTYVTPNVSLIEATNSIQYNKSVADVEESPA